MSLQPNVVDLFEIVEVYIIRFKDKGIRKFDFVAKTINSFVNV